MRIKSIKASNFKRFTDLTIEGIPDSAKLVVLVGPNGSGKTSLFEVFHHWYMFKGFGNVGAADYVVKKSSKASTTGNWYEKIVDVVFHDEISSDRNKLKGKFYFRSAYRNEPDFNINRIDRFDCPTNRIKLKSLIDNDKTVSENYQRLVGKTIEGIYNNTDAEKTVDDLKDELIGRIKQSLSSIFVDLNLSSIGDPLVNGNFFFEKGASKDFPYKNLSAGEKSVFDLILDICIKISYYEDSIYCIDEPEAHMHTRLQAKVLMELYKLIPGNSQLWITTHSLGMIRKAEEIEKEAPGTVIFLDFDNRDFDSSEIIRPSKLDAYIWNKFYELAFGDFSQLISPEKIVFCEGTSKGRKYENFDSQIYERIFSSKYHNVKFVSVGSCNDIENIENQSMRVVSNILKSTEIIKFIDRDDRNAEEIVELSEKGIKTSEQRHIECYLLDDEIITKLCISSGKENLIDSCLEMKKIAIENSVKRNNPQDDIKSATGEIYNGLKRILGLTQCGSNSCSFLRDTVAPLITEETTVYKNLEKEIFY